MNAQTITIPSIICALAKALPELESAKKNKSNPAFKSKYADLAATIAAIEPIRAHGLWYRQVLHEREDGVQVETLYIHESGESLSSGQLFMPAGKKDAQGFGSALSYARRYSLQAAFGLATEDDDGNAAARGQSSSSAVSPSAAVINDTQWGEIVSLIEASKADTAAFCKAYGIGSLKELTAEAFPDAKRRLEKKLADLKEKEPA